VICQGVLRLRHVDVGDADHVQVLAADGLREEHRGELACADDADPDGPRLGGALLHEREEIHEPLLCRSPTIAGPETCVG